MRRDGHGCARTGLELPPHDRQRRSAHGEAHARRDTFSARAERLPAHRPRQEHLPQLWPRQRVRRHLQPALRRHLSHDRGRRVRRLDPGGRALARIRVEPSLLRLRLLRAPVRLRRRADQAGQGVRRQSLGRRDPRVPRHPDRARARQPVSQPFGRGEPRPLRAHARRRVPRRGASAARQDQHGIADRRHARPADLPHPSRDPPPHR